MFCKRIGYANKVGGNKDQQKIFKSCWLVKGDTEMPQ